MDGAVGANHVAPQKSRNGQYDMKCTRTVLLSNLAEGTTHADITDAVRGGLLLDIFLRPRDRCVALSFLHAVDARAFLDHVRKNDLYIKNKRVRTLQPQVGTALDLYLTNFDAGHCEVERAPVCPGWTCRRQDQQRGDAQPSPQEYQPGSAHGEEYPRRPRPHPQPGCHQGRVRWQGLPHQDQLDQLCALCAYVHDEPRVSPHDFYIRNLSLSLDGLNTNQKPWDRKYRGMRIEYGPDECARPYDADQQVKLQMPRREAPPQRKGSNLSNRFQLLNVDDGGSEEDGEEVSDGNGAKNGFGVAR